MTGSAQNCRCLLGAKPGTRELGIETFEDAVTDLAGVLRGLAVYQAAPDGASINSAFDLAGRVLIVPRKTR